MTHAQLKLSGGATAVPAVAWSADSDIAIAVGERVDVLVASPNLAPNQRSNSSRARLRPPVPMPIQPTVGIPASLYTELERPLLVPPLSFAHWSVGEELSRAGPTALAWSSPGLLSESRKSALAVLGGNGVLSIWGLVPDVQSDSGLDCSTGISSDRVGLDRIDSVRVRPSTGPQSNYWQRISVLNRLVEKWVMARASPEDETESVEMDESDDDCGRVGLGFTPATLGLRPEVVSTWARERRVGKCRCRAFSWLPPLRMGTDQSVWGSHSIVYVNDDGEIGLVWLDFSSRSDEGDEATEADNTGSIAGFWRIAPPRPRERADLFEEMCADRGGIHEIAVQDEWKETEDGATISLAAAIFGSIVVCDITVHQQDFKVQVDIRGDWRPPDNDHDRLDRHISALGPIRWAGNVDVPYLIVVYQNSTEIVCLEWPVDASSPTNQNGFPLPLNDFKADAVVDIAIVPSGDGSPGQDLHFATATGQDSPVLKIPDLTIQSVRPVWQHRLDEQRANYCRSNGLGSTTEVATRMYSLTPSPRGDLIAMAVSLHPAQMLEYRNAADEEVLFTISPSCLSGPIFKPARSWEMTGSAENIAVSTTIWAQRRLIENQSPTDHLLQLISKSWIGIEIKSFDQSTDPADLLHKRLFWDSRLGRKRAESVVIRAMIRAGVSIDDLEGYEEPPSVDSDIAHTVVKLIVQTIRTNKVYHGKLAQMYDRVDRALDHTFDTQDTQEPQDASEGQEECTLCSSGIPLEDLRVAKCARGHLFVRCALSFLTIQCPGVSRTCGLCSVIYLKPEVLINEDKRDDDSDGKSSIGHLLSKAIDLCVYCGGKFAG